MQRQKLLTLVVAFSFCLAAASQVRTKKLPVEPKKEISAVDVGRTKGSVIVNYSDGTRETLTEEEANNRGLVHNGGYGNFKQATTASGAFQLLRFADTTKRPLFVVDGVLVEHEALSKLKPDSIERVKVLKDSMATKKYGNRGRHGVIEIFMRGSRPINKDTNTLTGIVDYAAPLSDHMNGKKLWEVLGADERDEIVSWEVSLLDERGNVHKAYATGNNIPPQVKQLLQQARKGDLIVYGNIYVMYGGKKRKLPTKPVQL